MIHRSNALKSSLADVRLFVSRQAARVPVSIWLALFLETVFLISLAATDAYDVARTYEWFRVVLTYALVIALFAPVHLALGVNSRRARIASIAVFFVFITVDFAHFETTGTFDYGFIHENVRELNTPLGRRIVGSTVRPHEIVLLYVLPLLSAIVAAWWPRQSASSSSSSSSSPPLSKSTRILGFAACIAFLVGLPAMHVSTHEPVTSFFNSAYRFYAEQRRMDVAIGGKPFPLVREFVPSAQAASIATTTTTTKPHVITLLLESWSGIYTDRKNAQGRAFTPVFDAHRRDGLTFDHFYGSSIQSSRGRFATMCSLIPLYRGKEFNDLADAPLHCLPHVMNEAGYHSLIYSAADEPGFERSEPFFHHMGFTEVHFEEQARRAREPEIVWGAGLRDDVYYKEFFARLDAELLEHPNQPLFAVAINASNHYPFNRNPKQTPEPGLPTKYGRNYVASLRNADGWLSTFYEELDKRPAFRDAIVVLMGDHSFPADEHGIHFNGLGAREESFRTAFALRWKGHVTSRVDTEHTASQLDYAPTITDLAQISHTTTFQGRSLISGEADADPNIAPMVQPYDGVRLVAVHWPFKLEVHDAASQEHLYNLSKDADEDDDLLLRGTTKDDPRASRELTLLRGEIERIRRSQAILHAKRVWPGEPSDVLSSGAEPGADHLD